MAAINGAVKALLGNVQNTVERNRVTAENLTDEELRTCTRLDRETFLSLEQTLHPILVRKTGRNSALPVSTQLLVALSFLSSGSFQWMCGRTYNISQPSASRVIRKVIEALCEMAPRFIKFPLTGAERRRVKEGFFELGGMPNVVGAVDGTHVRIRAPSVNEHLYVNRKQQHTINVQLVCDSNLKILDVVARWPGSTHDAYMWSQCGLRGHILAENENDSWLIGDSGYPQEPWLMTPVRNPHNLAEEAYNKTHVTTRNPIERAIGLLKSRFRCLDRSGGDLLYSVQQVCPMVIACCVLHNICLDHGLIENVHDENEANKHIAPPPADVHVAAEGVANRNLLINNWFRQN